jgi:hypothetical protein
MAVTTVDIVTVTALIIIYGGTKYLESIPTSRTR